MYAFDLATGRKLDSALVEDTHPGGTAPYGNIIAGPDNVLYAHRCGDNVTAIEDLGDSLHVRWVHEVSDDPAAMWAQLACGPDSSVYALSNGRVVRLDPQTGAATDSSAGHQGPDRRLRGPHRGRQRTAASTRPTAAMPAARSTRFDPSCARSAVDSIFNVSTSQPGHQRLRVPRHRRRRQPAEGLRFAQRGRRTSDRRPTCNSRLAQPVPLFGPLLARPLDHWTALRSSTSPAASSAPSPPIPRPSSRSSGTAATTRAGNCRPAHTCAACPASPQLSSL